MQAQKEMPIFTRSVQFNDNSECSIQLQRLIYYKIQANEPLNITTSIKLWASSIYGSRTQVSYAKR